MATTTLKGRIHNPCGPQHANHGTEKSDLQKSNPHKAKRRLKKPLRTHPLMDSEMRALQTEKH
jgi:hypothetical protein